MTVHVIKAGDVLMQPSDHLLDNFVAHKLSSLTECGAPELSMATPWLNVFILNNVFQVRLTPEKRAYAFNIIRRAEGAVSAYREAREALGEYITTPRNTVSPYFRSLLNFEVCISQCWQGCQLIMRATGEKLFQKKGNSNGEVTQSLYRREAHGRDD
jgi:hypothetical protein